MNTIIQILSSGISSFMFMLIIIPVLKKIAVKINLTDKPSSRKIHQFPTPLIGGIGIAISILLTIIINPQDFHALLNQRVLFFSAIVLLIIGAFDDRFDINAKYKLVIQLLCAFAVTVSDIRIKSLYGLFGIYDIPIFAQYTLTIIVITGIVNAINLMDGVDGLLGELSIIGFSILLFFSILIGDYSLAAFYAAFLGSTLAFLKFNLSKNKIFMGDAGSLFIGNILIGSNIYLLNHSLDFSPLQPILLFSIIGFFALPVLDSLRVYLGRLKKGTSPFKADKTHIHHLFLIMGFAHKKIGLVISSISILILLFSILINPYASTTAIVVSIVIFFSILGFVLNLNKKVLEWREKLKQMEK